MKKRIGQLTLILLLPLLIFITGMTSWVSAEEYNKVNEIKGTEAAVQGKESDTILAKEGVTLTGSDHPTFGSFYKTVTYLGCNRYLVELKFVASTTVEKGTFFTDQIHSDILTNFNFYQIPTGIVYKSNGTIKSTPAVNYDQSTRIMTWDIGQITNNDYAILSYIVEPKYDFPQGTEFLTSPPYPGSEPEYLGKPNSYVTIINYDGNNTNLKEFFPNAILKVETYYASLKVEAGDDKFYGVGDDPVTIGGNPTAWDGTSPYTYKWTNNNDPLWTSNLSNPIVDPLKDTIYTVEVTDKCGHVKSDTVKVTVINRKIIIKKIVLDKNNNPISTYKEFYIRIDGPNFYFNHLARGDGGEVTFEGLRKGQYTITEPYVPYDFELVSISPQVINVDDSNTPIVITVTNRVKDGSWFYDEDEKDNYFNVSQNAGQVSLNNSEISENINYLALLIRKNYLG